MAEEKIRGIHTGWLNQIRRVFNGQKPGPSEEIDRVRPPEGISSVVDLTLVHRRPTKTEAQRILSPENNEPPSGSPAF